MLLIGTPTKGALHLLWKTRDLLLSVNIRACGWYGTEPNGRGRRMPVGRFAGGSNQVAFDDTAEFLWLKLDRPTMFRMKTFLDSNDHLHWFSS
jgi:hypothetical protein